MLSQILTIFFVALAALAAGAALAVYFERARADSERASSEKNLKTLHSQWTEALAGLDRSRTENAGHLAAIAGLEARLEAEKAAVEQMRKALPETFKSLASDVLEERSKRFSLQNQAELGSLLEPLKQRLTDFQKKVEDVHLEQVQGSATLRAQVEHLVEANNKITEEANNLARALKGSSKTQGNWGELILETILESSGLREGHEYETQERYAGENGKRGQPDVVIHLAGERHLVVDAKVSLLHYEAYCRAEDDADRTVALNGHLNSVRAHIKGLSEKNYQTLYGLKSLDFVVMFVPIEPAFMLALSKDDRLWQQAWQKNVLLVSPSTLLFVLRTVAHLWRQERQSRNADEIASRGADLYNKLAGFVQDLEEIGKRLAQAQESYCEAAKKLSTGPGNVIRQAELLKTLGVKPTKQLPQGIVELAQQEILELSDAPSRK